MSNLNKKKRRHKPTSMSPSQYVPVSTSQSVRPIQTSSRTTLITPILCSEKQTIKHIGGGGQCTGFNHWYKSVRAILLWFQRMWSSKLFTN